MKKRGKKNFKRVVIISIILLLILLGVFYIFYTSNKELFLSPVPYPTLSPGAVCLFNSLFLGVCPKGYHCFSTDASGVEEGIENPYIYETGYGVAIPSLSGLTGKCLQCQQSEESGNDWDKHCNDKNPCTEDKCSPGGNCYYMPTLSINPVGCDSICGGKCVNKVCVGVNNNNYCVEKTNGKEVCRNKAKTLVLDICDLISNDSRMNTLEWIVQYNCPSISEPKKIYCDWKCKDAECIPYTGTEYVSFTRCEDSCRVMGVPTDSVSISWCTSGGKKVTSCYNCYVEPQIWEGDYCVPKTTTSTTT